MKPYIIAATGTDIGKTFVTCLLTRQLLAQNKSVRALKPVVSGFTMENVANSDSGLLLKAQGLPLADLNAISPWRYTLPLSPDMAAKAQNTALDFEALLEFCRIPQATDYLLVETAGGVMSPLTDTHTMLDWMVALGWPVILVAGSYLGAISHTLTAFHALRAQGVTPHSLVISESESPPVPLSELTLVLRHFLPASLPIAHVARLDSARDLWQDIPDITATTL